MDSAGTLIALRLDERIRARPAARTAEQVLATTRAAHLELLRLVTEATRETLGPDDPAAGAIIDSYGRTTRRDRRGRPPMPAGEGIEVVPADLTSHAGHLDGIADALRPPGRPARPSGSAWTLTASSAG